MKYKVAFNGNISCLERVGGMPEKIWCNRGELLILPKELPVCRGYIFAGWNTQADGSGEQFQPEGVIGPITADLCLFAQWMCCFDCCK